MNLVGSHTVLSFLLSLSLHLCPASATVLSNLKSYDLRSVSWFQARKINFDPVSVPPSDPEPPSSPAPLLWSAMLLTNVYSYTQLLRGVVLLAVARKLTASREILLWMTPSEAPKALQASDCSELLDPMRASCWISAQH